MKLKFLHYADIQIEIRVAGTNAQRLDEYLAVLQKMETIVKDTQPDIVFIPGDVFEYQDANGDETKMFSKHIHSILPHTKRIVIIPGNHDIRQKSNGVMYLDVKQNSTDHIDSTITAINNPKISYYKHTGIYKDTAFPISYAVWSQIDKWSAQDPKPNYNPWVDNDVPEGALIELFHDPIKGAKDFSGQPSEHFANYGISLADFKANTVIAGDIHNPDIIWFGENTDRLFTYSSSLVQRNSGEGDYWSNLNKVVSGNMKHGYNVIDYDTDLNLATSCKFHQVHNPVSRHTIRLTDAFNYETMIPSLQIDNTEFNKIRVICHAKLSEFIEHEQEIIEHLRSKYNCSVQTDWAKDVIDVQVDESEFENLDQVIDKDKILDISKKYISTIVEKSATIGKEDKQAAKDLIFEIFEKELATAELTSNRTSIQLLDAEISGFMSFARDVTLQFKNNDITVISGTNGVGKTTIFHFLKWMYCDKISDFQNERNKKLNYSLYFNDSSEEDVVLGQLRFNVNGNNIYTVKKTLTRDWKKGTKDIRDKNWIDNLKGVPVVGMSITSNDFNSDNAVECMEHLKTLITYKELNRLVFVNGISLSNLINTNPEDLSSEFLTILGLDFLNNLLETFESVKDEKLSKLDKPAQTLEDVLKSIENITTSKETSVETIKRLELDYDELLDEQRLKDIELNNKRSTLHQVGTEEEIQISIDALSTINAQKQLEIDACNTAIELINEQKKVNSIESLTNDIHKKELELQSSKIAIDMHNSKVISDERNLESLKQSTIAIAGEIRNKINEKILKLIAVKDASTKELSEKEEAKRQILKTYQSKIQESITKINTAIDSKELSKQEIETKRIATVDKISDLAGIIHGRELLQGVSLEKIETLKNSKLCPTCNQEKSKEALASIELTIAKILEDNKGSEANNINDAKRKLAEEEVLSEYITEINTINASIETFKKLRDSYSKKLNTIDAEKYPELIKANDDIDKDIEKLKLAIAVVEKSIKDVQDSIADTIKADQSYIDANMLLSNAQSELIEFKASKDAKTAKVDTINSEIIELQTLKRTISEFDNTIAEHQLTIDNIKLTISENTTKTINYLKDLNFAKVNVDIKAAIKLLENARDEHNNLVVECKAMHDKEVLEASRYDERLVTLNTTIDEIKKYKLVESSLKLYKKLLGKTGLPQYIFAHLVPLINKKLNDTLENVDFRLLFDDETLELRFIDLKKNISRPVQFVSGMQETLTGLALINIFRILNNSKCFNILMIDEISGKLNDGKDLTYESKNYKKLTTDFIRKLSTNVNIYIIDHVLEFYTARKIEIQPTDEGAIITEIS